VLGAAGRHKITDGRTALHALPIGYSLDGQDGIRDPRGMVGDVLGVDVNVVTADRAAQDNLALAIHRCHLDVSAVVAAPDASGLAALAMHGVPATTRETNHAVILATGHCATAEESVDWEALARAGAPIVLYMAVSNLAAIAQALMRGGLSGATPTLVVHGATTPRETLLEAPLAQLPALAERGAIASPAIVAIGAIAAFRQEIAGHLQAFRTAVGE